MVSFKVSNVETAVEPMEEVTTRLAVQGRLKKIIESCSDWMSPTITCGFHPVLFASSRAFDQHRPLVLSPDILWLTIAQGISLHVNSNSEKLRDKFVSFQGKKEILIQDDSLVKGAQENGWPRVFGAFSSAIKEQIGAENHSILVQKFSTTGPVEMAANEVVLMDVVKSYFEYTVRTCCGIPEVILEGKAEDYQQILDSLSRIKGWDLEWWFDKLFPVLEGIAKSARGDYDAKFWDSWYNEGGGSGGPYISGHVTKFFPYLKNYQDNGNFSKRNEFEERGWGGGITSDRVPTGLSQVPFKWEYLSRIFDMFFVAGFVGMTQDKATMALRPKIGWAVMDQTAKNDPGYFKVCKGCQKEVPYYDMAYQGAYCHECHWNLPEATREKIEQEYYNKRYRKTGTGDEE